MFAPGCLGFFERASGGSERRYIVVRDGIICKLNGLVFRAGECRGQNPQAQRWSVLNPDSIVREQRHVGPQLKFQVLDHLGGALSRHHALKAEISDIGVLAETHVEELHVGRTFKRRLR